MRGFAHQHHGHVGLLHNQMRKQGGKFFGFAGVGLAGRGRGFAHCGLLLRLALISASKKWISRRSRASTSTVSRMLCRSVAPGNTAHETKSAACSGSEMESR